MTRLAISCRDLSKTFDATEVVSNVDLDVEADTILVVVGPSGCGKTTLLRLIAGFETPDRGRIEIGGKVAVGQRIVLPPERRRAAMVFQDYALFPHLDVFHNVAFGLRRDSEQRQRVHEVLDLVGLTGRGRSLPHELSGGEQQRVALARALAPRPEVLLLDEPFSNLDAGLRKQLRTELKDILRRARAAAVFVTHDQDEAFFLGDELAVMNTGRLEQVGSPEILFHQPATHFVARFLGVADFLAARVENKCLRTAVGDLLAPPDVPHGASVQLMLRPDDVTLKPASPGNATIVDRTFRGTHYLYVVRLEAAGSLHVLTPHTECYPVGEAVDVQIDAGHPVVTFVNGQAAGLATVAKDRSLA